MKELLSQKPLAKRGVLLLASQKNEWIFPWWKINYLIKNTLPVAIADVGLSEKAKKWCQNIATVVPIAKEKLQAPLTLKEVALLASPFEETLYLEPYMQVRSDLSEIFAFLSDETPLVLTKNGASLSQEVMAYRKEEKVVSWFLKEIKDHHIEEKAHILPPFYNWAFETSGDNLFAQIVNRKGSKSEIGIRQQMLFFEEKLHIRLGMLL